MDGERGQRNVWPKKEAKFCLAVMRKMCLLGRSEKDVGLAVVRRKHGRSGKNAKMLGHSEKDACLAVVRRMHAWP